MGGYHMTGFYEDKQDEQNAGILTDTSCKTVSEMLIRYPHLATCRIEVI